ncbi:MAG: beta-propeller domain-containing protein [Pseudomonadota bacterium]
MPFSTHCRPALRKWFSLSLFLPLIVGVAPAAQAAAGEVRSAAGDAWIRIGKPHVYADVFLETDRFTGVYTLTPKATDVGQSAKLVLVARVNNRWFSHDGQQWQPWNSSKLNELRTYATRPLAATETLPIISDSALFAGDYAIFAGYQVGSNALVYNDQPLQFRVHSSSSDALLPFASDASMEAYLKQGLQEGTAKYGAYDPRIMLATTNSAVPTAGATDKSASTESRTSSTNLQEAGVDEADNIKVDGNMLYLLAACDNKACLEAHTLDSGKPSVTPVSKLQLGNTIAPDGMFLVERGILGQKMMVTVAGQNSWGGWFSLWGWREGKTELEFINLSLPQAMSSIEKLTLDGSLVSSRRVGNMLYVVTRYTPAVEGFNPYPAIATDGSVSKEQAANEAVLAKTTLPDILPRVEDSRKKIEDLVKSKDCYLPTSAVDGNFNPSIITITSVPLDAPTKYTSTCFLGASETLYMTPESLYLATTSWDYDVAAMEKGLRYSPSHTTSIHKFALASGKIEYRGSGEVKGHLGWDEDKKSFRMGEHNGYLNIATSIGESWTGTSSTRLTVLKEVAGSRSLQTVKVIDGIGLKGEQLYAARFLGDRGYLVTFRVTDPLYVLDLSNQEQPKIVGELKIDGYSDYLHPVSDTLLLGIGKDAIPDTSSTDETGRGAWYQGVKLSLFDVSNPASPKEIDSKILGKRGTHTDVAYDHHALSFLPASGNEPARLAIPLQLHDKVPSWEGFRASQPNAWYDYTHTALYSFELSKLGISQVGKIISEVAPANQPKVGDPRIATATTSSAAADSTAATSTTDTATSKPAIGILPVDPGFAPVYVYYNDRSVLKDNAVFYIHDGKVLSSLWGESK